MHISTDAHYAERVTDGTYAAIVQQLLDLGPNALANVSCPGDFSKSTFAPPGTKSFMEEYATNETGKPFDTILVGEICPTSMGTRISATGSFYLGDNKIIDDKTSVKQAITLRCPTLSNRTLTIIYHNQVATLNEIRQDDQRQEAISNRRPSIVNECIKSDENNPSAPADLIVVTMDRMYVVPPEDKKDTKDTSAFNASKPVKHTITKKRIVRDSDTETLGSDKEDDNMNPKVGSSIKGKDNLEVSVGAFYPPQMLPDFGGPMFDIKAAKLVQYDYRDVDNNLITPWDAYAKLRPGTVVLVHASPIVWVMQDGGIDGPLKKYYQLRVHSLKVLAESIEEIEPRTKRTTNRPMHRATRPSTPPKDSASSRAFEMFKSPSKRARQG